MSTNKTKPIKKSSQSQRPKDLVELVKGKIKTCENCKTTGEAKKCITDIVQKT